MYKFKYENPNSLDEATALFNANEDATYMAGGMTLLPTLKQRLAMPSHVIDLSKIPNLKGVSFEGGMLKIGAMTTHAEVAAAPLVAEHIPSLAVLAGNIGDASVRNRGTIGGSLANSDPAADYPAAVLALGASITTNLRTIKAEDYFVELFETALEEGEIITEISFPAASQANYQKFSNPASRYAVAGVFVAKTAAGVRVAVTGAGAYAFRASDFEAALDKEFSVAAIEKITVASDDLNEDVHATPNYRAHLINVLTMRAVEELL